MTPHFQHPQQPRLRPDGSADRRALHSSIAGAALLVVLAGCAGGDREPRSGLAADSSKATRPDTPAVPESAWHKVFAHSINDAGVVAGVVRRADYSGCAVVWDAGAARPLAVPSNRFATSANDINTAGAVAGSTSTPRADGGSSELASLWNGARIRELRGPGGETSDAVAVNASGHIAGIYRRADGSERAFLWNGSRSQDLGDSPNPEFARVFASDINDQGTVVGYLLPVQENGPEAIKILGSRAFIWRDGVMRELLPDSNFIEIEARGINSEGDVVGSLTPRSTERKVAFLLSGGKLTQLAPPAGWRESEAVAINERGEIVGSATDSLSRVHAIIWEGGRMRELGSPTGGSNSRATSINSSGHVVGYTESAGERTRAFRWENGTMRELLPPATDDPRCRPVPSPRSR